MKPYLTEKTYLLSTQPQPVFTFLISPLDTIATVKAKIKQLYKKQVIKVRFVKNPGRKIIRRGVKGVVRGRRKALVTLAKGEKIAAFEVETEKDKKEQAKPNETNK